MIFFLALAAAAVLLLAPGDDSPGWTSAEGRVLATAGGCDRAPGPDLGFSRLPPIHEAPAVGYQPSAPYRVRLERYSGSLVVPGTPYWIHLTDETRRQVSRGWRMRAQLLFLGRDGRPVAEVSHAHLPPPARGERWSERKLRLRVGDSPGYYRLDYQIGGGNRPPRAYSAYLRAEPAHGEARLAIDRRAVRPGETLGSRVESLGTEDITFGNAAWIEHRVDGVWSKVPMAIYSDLVRYGIPTGAASACSGTEVPDLVLPGTYRLVKEVDTLADPRGYDDHYVTAEFEVVH